jgi:hypothetical protein
MLHEESYEAVVERTSGQAEVTGAGGVKPGGAAEGGATGASALPEAGEPRGEGKVEGGVMWFSAFEARRAIMKRGGELEGLGENELVVVRVDPQRVADTALGIARRDSTPERRVLFERFAAQGNYDIRHLDHLPDYAQIVWHTRREQAIASHHASGAALPEGEVAAAYETRARMMRVLDYQLGDRHDIQELLAYLREGSGYLDLANDLHTLAVTYGRDDVRPQLEKDAKHYRASDVEGAVRYAEAIRASQGPATEGEVERLAGLYQRAVTLLVRSYGEHRRVGQFLFGPRENVAVTYPSLVAAVRTPRRKRAADGAGDGEGPGDEPGDEPSGETPVDEL